jgi:hypothetical protein
MAKVRSSGNYRGARKDITVRQLNLATYQTTIPMQIGHKKNSQ